MEIVWYGHSCFRMKTRGAAVVTDPCGKEVGYNIPRLRADVVTVSRKHPDYCNTSLVQGASIVIDGPGEYEVKAIFVTGIAERQKKKEAEAQRNTIYVFDFDGLTVCHLGSIDHVPSQAQVQILVDIDVLLIPVGAVTTINANQAAEMIGLIQPKIVVPMHYGTKATTLHLDPLGKFLKEMGLPANTGPRDSLEVTSSDLPAETQVVVLNYRE
jgi:L-ascorbate metabolism protein UlaG (beta-lactamase superfamily)